MSNIDDSQALPSYPVMLTEDDSKILLLLVKIYQIYYGINEVRLIEHKQHDNFYVHLTHDNESTIFPWFEFVLFEIPSLINVLYTEIEGTYSKEMDEADLLKKLDFLTIVESLDNWSADLTTDSFQDDGTINVEYVYKLFICSKDYKKRKGDYPDTQKVYMETLIESIDDYYKENIFFEDDDDDDEIDPGVLQMHNEIVDGEEQEEENNQEEEVVDEVVEENGDKIVVKLSKKKYLENGLYRGF